MRAVSPAALLPHRPPFRFVDSAEVADGGRARCRFRIPEAGSCWSLRMSPEMLLVEIMAQSCAIALAAPGEEGDAGPVRGVLGGVDRFRFTARPRPGDEVRVDVVLRKRLGPVALFDGEAFCGERTLGRGSLTVRVGEVS